MHTRGLPDLNTALYFYNLKVVLSQPHMMVRCTHATHGCQCADSQLAPWNHLLGGKRPCWASMYLAVACPEMLQTPRKS